MPVEQVQFYGTFALEDLRRVENPPPANTPDTAGSSPLSWAWAAPSSLKEKDSDGVVPLLSSSTPEKPSRRAVLFAESVHKEAPPEEADSKTSSGPQRLPTRYAYSEDSLLDEDKWDQQHALKNYQLTTDAQLMGVASLFLFFGFLYSVFTAFTVPLEAVRMAATWQNW